MAYYRIAIAGPCAEGSASLGWRAKEALESLGHTVFPFCPALQPWLFDERGDLDGAAVSRFLERQEMDFLLLAQGCLLQRGASVPPSCALGLLASGDHLSGRAADEIADSGASFTFAVGERAKTLALEAGLPPVVALVAVADSAWGSTPLANTVAEGPFELSNDPFDNAFAYLAHTGLSESEVTDDFLRAELRARRALPRAGLRDGHEIQSPRRSLEEELARGLEEVRPFLAPGQAPGTDEPRVVVCALAYVGRGNFGDEYIYQTIDRRLRRAYPGATLVAVSEDPRHTLVHRGTYAISQANLALLDHVLARSSVALVLAGLLFDQGIRWTMGKAETFGYPIHSDIPGITEFCTLAHLNGAQPVFYGIGAGPLEVGDSKRLVSLVGELGAVFMTRDGETAQLVRACPVPEGQVTTYADVAFLGDVRHAPAVDDWVASSVPEGNQMLAISLRDYETMPADFAERVACALDRFVESHPMTTPVFCILDPGDAGLSRQIVGLMADGSVVRTFDPRDDLDALVDLLARCRLGLSMRYHCSLVLMRSGVPTCGLDYLPKVGSLYRELGVADALLSPDASADDLFEVLCRLEGEHEERGAQALEAADAMARRAGEAEQALWRLIDAGRHGKEGGIPTTFFLRGVPEVDVRAEERLKRARDEANAEREQLQAQVEELRHELAEARGEVEAVRDSTSYRVGNAAVRPLVRLRDALRRK